MAESDKGLKLLGHDDHSTEREHGACSISYKDWFIVATCMERRDEQQAELVVALAIDSVPVSLFTCSLGCFIGDGLALPIYSIS